MQATNRSEHASLTTDLVLCQPMRKSMYCRHHCARSHRLQSQAPQHCILLHMTEAKKKKPSVAMPHAPAQLRRMRGPSPQKTELTYKEILQAALDEFTEVGIAKATMDKIAKRANVAKGTLYLHFKNKEALLQGALEATIAYSALASMQTQRLPSESVKAYISRLVIPSMERFHQSGRAALARLVLGEARSHPSLMEFYYQNILTPWHAHFERLFQIAADEGELQGIPAATASQLLGSPFWISLVHDAMGANGVYPGIHPAELTRAQIECIFSSKPNS